MDLTTLPEDLTVEEKQTVSEFVANGCPGLVKIDDTKVFRWFELYMAGKSYYEIAQLTKDKKDLIMYISCRAKWHDTRMAYYRDMSATFTSKLKKVKMSSANTVINALTALGKYHDKKFNDFLVTNDKSIIETMDTKLMAQYYKSLEMIDKLIRPEGEDHEKEPKQPLVNITVPAGSTITQTGDKSIEIGSDEAASNVLKAIAAFQRSKDK